MASSPGAQLAFRARCTSTLSFFMMHRLLLHCYAPSFSGLGTVEGLKKCFLVAPRSFPALTTGALARVEKQGWLCAPVPVQCLKSTCGGKSLLALMLCCHCLERLNHFYEAFPHACHVVAPIKAACLSQCYPTSNPMCSKD